MQAQDGIPFGFGNEINLLNFHAELGSLNDLYEY